MKFDDYVSKEKKHFNWLKIDCNFETIVKKDQISNKY